MSINFVAPNNLVSDLAAIQNDWFSNALSAIFTGKIPPGYSVQIYKPIVCKAGICQPSDFQPGKITSTTAKPSGKFLIIFIYFFQTLWNFKSSRHKLFNFV